MTRKRYGQNYILQHNELLEVITAFSMVCLRQICVIFERIYFSTLSESLSLKRILYFVYIPKIVMNFTKLKQSLPGLLIPNTHKKNSHEQMKFRSNENGAATHKDGLTLSTHELVLRALLRPLHHHNENENNFHKTRRYRSPFFHIFSFLHLFSVFILYHRFYIVQHFILLALEWEVHWSFPPFRFRYLNPLHTEQGQNERSIYILWNMEI